MRAPIDREEEKKISPGRCERDGGETSGPRYDQVGPGIIRDDAFLDRGRHRRMIGHLSTLPYRISIWTTRSDHVIIFIATRVVVLLLLPSSLLSLSLSLIYTYIDPPVRS